MLEEGKKEKGKEEMKEGREKRKSHESISSVALLSPARCFILFAEYAKKCFCFCGKIFIL